MEKAVRYKKGKREKQKERKLLLSEILEMDQSAYFKLAFCIIAHSSVVLPAS